MQNYFKHIDEVENKINKEYNVTQKEVDDMVQIIKDWLKSQDHLPLEEDGILTARIKCFLRKTKMSIQITKEKLDLYYSIRNIYPQYFLSSREPLNKDLQLVSKLGYYLPLRKPMNLTRVWIGTLEDNDISKWNIWNIQMYTLNMIEIAFIYDYCIELIIIADLKNITLTHAMSMSPTEMFNIYNVFQKAYPDRVAGIHYINCPPFMKTMAQALTSLLKPKLAIRVQVHESLESIYEIIPKDYLPVDLGGYEPPLDEQRDEWVKFLHGNNDFIKNNIAIKSNEKLRTGKPIDSQLFGLDGSFRKLDID